MRSIILVGLLALTGCHLIDQRDFNPHAGEKPKPPAARPGPSAAPPLLTINYANGAPNYAVSLARAVHNALALKPGVLFSVQTLVPPAATLPEQQTALNDAAATGREIAEAIITDGAEPPQVEQSVRADTSVHSREVRIFVR